MDFLFEPWPWYVSGVLIALVMVLLIFSGREFGVSANLRTICAIMGGGKTAKFFDFDWKSQVWNLIFVIGALIGGALSHIYLMPSEPLAISDATVKDLGELGITYTDNYFPVDQLNLSTLFTPTTLILVVLGGLFVGFGTRYAGGCTSGHAISGLSNLQIPSLIAVIGFFVGGLITTHLLLPLIFNL